MKISIQTLGCKVNQSESAAIEGLLRNNNYEVVKHDDSPDVCIINTCTVTAKSDYQSRQLIRRAVKFGARVIATGCYTQLKPDDLSKIDGLSLMIGNSEKANIIDHIKKLSTKNSGTSTIIAPPGSPLMFQPYYSGRSRAFLKIQDGCNFSCSYCTVPLARGRSRSLKPEDVMLSVKKLFDSGYREIVLTGIHIGSYGIDIRPGNFLIDIVNKMVSSFPDIRIRLSSIEPQEFNEDFLSLMKDGNVCRHLHIPLQSPYSKRPNTKAAISADHVGEKIKKERVKKLLDIGNKKKYDYMAKNIDKYLDVIVEQKSEKTGSYKVLSDNYLKIELKSDNLSPGQRLKVRVISLTGDKLRGEPVE
jgi:threonylcarbamoyladenosine tRNA methylthiotransferase MtaB